jgi:hypothetical protein
MNLKVVVKGRYHITGIGYKDASFCFVELFDKDSIDHDFLKSIYERAEKHFLELSNSFLIEIEMHHRKQYKDYYSKVSTMIGSDSNGLYFVSSFINPKWWKDSRFLQPLTKP